MKRTELEKRERKLKQRQKKDDVLARKTLGGSGKPSVNQYIESLFSLLRYDYEQVFNTKDDMDILELFEMMKSEIPEKQWDNVIKKAIKKTNVEQKDRAVEELLAFLDEA